VQSEFDALFTATINRIQTRLAADPSLKTIQAKLEDYAKRMQQAQQDYQRRAEAIAREEWTTTMKQVQGR
jgi:ABC-type Zn uptake system ZnuABC Zn-binding protein ZnuA